MTFLSRIWSSIVALWITSMPVKSASSKIPIGNPILNFTAESISSSLRFCLCFSQHASWTMGMKRRFTISPGTSFLQTTGSFFTDLTNSTVRSSTSCDVFWPGMTSTSFINCGGLKKWIPMNLWGLLVVLAISVIGRVLVFDAKTVFSLATESNSA